MKIMTLGELGTFKNGVNYKAEQSGRGISLINVKDITANHRISPESLDLVDVSIDEDLVALPTDLFFVRSSVKFEGIALVGRLGHIDRPCVHCGFVIRFRPITDQLHTDYLLYLLLSPEYREKLKALSSGAAITNISQTSLKTLEVPIPLIDIQQKIVLILSTYDDLITLNQRRIQLLEESARLLYREWFIKLRFPGHESVEVKDGVPEGWQVTRLARVADVNRASLGSKDKPESILYVDISAVTPGEIGEYREYSFEDAPGRARRKVAHGDIIWSCVRPNRRSYALIWEPDERLIVSTGFAVLTATTLPFSYLYLATTTDEFVGYLEKRATGAAYPAVTGKDFENAPILLPDNETLNQFDGLILPVLEQIEILKRQNKELRQARDLLLPKLMSGALDVSRIALPDDTNV
ncbi:MAG: restriction endonuclease subunit S [Candidatus Competibacteraceae bacterium]